MLTSLLCLLMVWTTEPKPPSDLLHQPVDPCRIFGIVFQDPNPFRATYRIFVVEDEYEADLVVFRERNRLMADKTGMWFYTPNPAFADFSVALVDDPNRANFKVYFTDIDVEARCNR